MPEGGDRLWDAPGNPSPCPQLHINSVAILPITAKLSLFATESCPSHPSAKTCHLVSSFSPSLLSALEHPRQKEKKKIPVLVPGDQQEQRQWSTGSLMWETGR